MSASVCDIWDTLSGFGVKRQKSSTALTGDALLTAKEKAPRLLTIRTEKLIVTVEAAEEFFWLKPMIRKLGELLALTEKWDSYKAHRIDLNCVIFALETLLPAILLDGTFLPAVVPTNSGGLQFEWHMCGVDLEIEIASPNNVRVYYEDLESGEEWEKEIHNQDFSEISDIVAHKLSMFDESINE